MQKRKKKNKLCTQQEGIDFVYGTALFRGVKLPGMITGTRQTQFGCLGTVTEIGLMNQIQKMIRMLSYALEFAVSVERL